MSKVRRGVAGVLLATALIAAGCGGDEEEDAGGGQGSAGQAQQEAGKPADIAALLKGKELTFVSFGGAY